MKPPRYQFTLRQLMVLVAFCAISLALLATTASLVVLWTWIVLPGIAIDRARGGRGVVGGTVAGGIAAIGFTVLFARVADYGPLQPVNPASLFFSALFALPFGLLFGAIMSGCVCEVLWLPQRGLVARGEERCLVTPGGRRPPIEPGSTPDVSDLTAPTRTFETGMHGVFSSSRREQASEPCGFPRSDARSGSSPR